MRTMVCISGEEKGFPVLHFGTWFATRVGTTITVLYVEKEPTLSFKKETEVALEKLMEWNVDLPAVRVIRMAMKRLEEVSLLKMIRGKPKLAHDLSYFSGGWELHLESREGHPIRLRTRQGNVVEQILAENRIRHHDLVIIGESKSRGFLSKTLFFLDSSILVLNNLIDHKYGVMLATDGSEIAHKAEYVGIKTAQYFGRKLTLMSVVNSNEEREVIEKHFERMGGIIKKRGISFDVIIRSGGIVDNVVEAAGNNKIIFLGDSRRNLLSKYIFGSKTLQICRRAASPVFIVKKTSHR